MKFINPRWTGTSQLVMPIIALFLISLMLSKSAHADEEALQDDENSVEELVQSLGASTFAARTEAYDTLAELLSGFDSYCEPEEHTALMEMIKVGLDSDDHEIVLRVTKLIEEYGDDGDNDYDGDGLSNREEAIRHWITEEWISPGHQSGRITYRSDPCNADTDNDGLDDGEENRLWTDPTNPDTDGDGYSDFEEVAIGSDPLDPCDPAPYGPDCNSYGDDEADTDNDDGELNAGTEPGDIDIHGEGGFASDEMYTSFDFNDCAEYGTDCDGEEGTIPDSEYDGDDTDNDGLDHGEELNDAGTEPVHADEEALQDDENSVEELVQSLGASTFAARTEAYDTLAELLSGFDSYCEPEEHTALMEMIKVGLDSDDHEIVLRVTKLIEEYGDDGDNDYDGDGLSNREEAIRHWITEEWISPGHQSGRITYRSDPCNADTDNDGLDDGEENRLWTDPTNPDTDGDGYSDFEEVAIGSDPLDPCDPVPYGSDCTTDGNYESDTYFF